MTALTPQQIVDALDRHIVGQKDAKRAVAIALRNRWRRRQVGGTLGEEITPKNILMIGPTGVGKTEISRRLASLAKAPFIKVEATKFTEVGYVGRDVEQIVRDLVEAAILLLRKNKRTAVRGRAEAAAQDRLLDALVGPAASPATRESFRQRLRAGDLDDKDVELEMSDTASPFQSIEIPGMPPGAGMGMLDLGEMLGKSFGKHTSTRRLLVADAHAPLLEEESDKLLDDSQIVAEAISLVENDGIVFLDEIDKITVRAGAQGGEVSREGVQRDLLPLIEGTTVTTKHGPVSTEHILFIASGAFHLCKPSDMLPELQGRLPIRVELRALTRDDFKRILTEPEASLIRQYCALMATENITLEFKDEAIDALADMAASVNANVENIGARRLQTIMEKLLEEVSFSASDEGEKTVVIDRAYVLSRLETLAQDTDLSKFIL